MLVKKLEKKIAKKVVVLFIISAILDIMFLANNRWIVLIGLIVGSVFSLLRFHSSATAFTTMLSKTDGSIKTNQVLIKYVLNQLMALLILAASLRFSLWLFAGVAAGILFVPFVIMFNSITQALGITRNNYE